MHPFFHLDVLVDVMRLDLLAALNAERSARRAAILVTEIASGEQRFVREAGLKEDPLSELLTQRLALGKSGMVEALGKQFFLTVQTPLVKVVVIGAVHITQAIAPMAKILDLDLTIVDPRTAFATPDRFPETKILAQWPQEVLSELKLDAYTALVALTHDPKIDDDALIGALQAQCFYVGALGSRKTHARRLERLAAQGMTEQQLALIHAPVGLDIGSVSPAEIAVAILAEIISVQRQDRRRTT